MKELCSELSLQYKTLERWIKEEKEKGLAAKEFCKNFCKEGEPAILKTKTYDASGKYGRILGEIWSVGEFGDKSINEYLIERGHAKEYFGGKR